jgi:uncharacterized protein involved in exopolysaccharide biosynthesis/Mrp family chromosome partitioning ATPase
MSPYRSLTSYAPPGLAPPPAFQFADFIRLVHDRRALILKVAAATVIAAVIAALLLPTVWSASAVVMLDQRKNNVTDMSAVLSQLPADPATLQNQIQILTSRELAGKVVDAQNLANDPEFNPTLPPQGFGPGVVLHEALLLLDPRNWSDNRADIANRDRVIDNFLRHVKAEAVGLSTTITISVTAQDAAKAARLTNALAEAYVRAQVTDKLDVTDNTTRWLGDRVNQLAEQLQVQDAAIQRYKAEHGLNDAGPGNSLVDQQMSAINGQIVQARSDLAAKQALDDRVAALAKSGDAGEIAEVAASPLIVQLRTQEADLVRQEGDLASKYGPLHPKMQAIEAQKRDLDSKIQMEIGRISGALANDVVVARVHLGSLQASLGGAERESNSQNMSRVQLAAMQSDAASTRTMYEAFVQRLRQSQDQDAVQAPESRIISAASEPRSPASPKRKLIVGASIPLGLLLGLLAALLAEKFGPLMPVRVNGAPRAALMAAPAMRPRRRSAPPAMPKAVWSGPPILGEFNDAAPLKAADYVLDYPASRFAQNMTALVRQLEARPASGVRGGAAVVALTSAGQGENRSAIAVGLARAAARQGKKTVIVDCAPALMATRAIRAPVRHGLYEVLTGSVPLNKALAKDPRGTSFLLGTPRRPANAVTMFASRPMARLVSILRGGADFVVLDCGAAGAGPDAALIARLADATVLVARRAELYAPALANAARILESAKAAPVGIVVTK